MKKTKKTNSSEGFSFVELMVVIAIIGILSAIALPSFLHSLPEKRLKNAARILYVDLQKARLLAVKENKKVDVTFATTAKKYSYPDGDGIKTVDLVELYGDVSYGCTATLTNWEGTAIGGISDIGFKAVGTADARSDIYLQSQKNQDICYAVTTSNLGIVRIRRFGGSVWDK